MNRPFNVPDEFVEGFLKAGESLWRSLGWAPNSDRDGANLGSALNLSGRLAELQAEHMKRLYQLTEHVIKSAAGVQGEGGIEPARGDRRFNATEWRDDAAYSLLKQCYLLNSRYCVDFVEALDLDEKEKHRLRFFTRQLIEAMSPTNFLATNPDVIKLATDSEGQSLKAGLENLMSDLGRGSLTITDEEAFEVGKDVAASRGAVVFENELFQLIQYAPATEQVAARPLLIVPPCINKFYILDLQPANSFVRFAVENGFTVFVVSWRNPDASCGHIRWDDYVEDGAIRAIDIARSISGVDKINVLGWCVGGTILSSALAILRTRGDESVASVTLLTTMLDFREPGDLGVFVDEEGVRQREQTIGREGIYRGAELGFVFQDAAVEGADLAERDQQLSEGKVAGAFRSAVLERGCHQPSRTDVLLLHQEHVPGEQSSGAEPVDNVRHSCRSGPGRSACLRAGDRRRSYRAVAIGLSHHRPVQWQHPLCARRQWAHCRRDQSRLQEQAKLLAVGPAMRRSRRVACERRRKAGQLVERLDRVAQAVG